MLNALVSLAIRTLQEPRAVASEIIAMRLERQMLWIALALAVVLNTIVYQISLVASPPTLTLPTLFSSPILFAFLVGSGLILSIFSLTYAGRILGGKATLEHIMSLLIWLQYLRFVVQLVALVLMPIIPGLTGILVFAASLYGVWLMIQFIDVGHGFNSLLTSIGALGLSWLMIMIGMAILLTLVGIQNMGLTPYV